MVTINFKKRDLWLITTIIIFIAGIGIVFGFGDYRTGNPKVFGHSSDEVMVLNKAGAEVKLQEWIDGQGSISIAQAYRKDGPSNNRPIITISGNSSAFVELNDKTPLDSTQTTLDGIGCDGTKGWKIAGCWISSTGSGEDLYPFDNGCITKKYDNEAAKMTVVCIKVS